MKLFTHIDNAINKATEFINSKTEEGAGWGEKADGFFKLNKEQTREAAQTFKEKTVETFETVGEAAQNTFNRVFQPEETTEGNRWNAEDLTEAAPKEEDPIVITVVQNRSGETKDNDLKTPVKTPETFEAENESGTYDPLKNVKDESSSVETEETVTEVEEPTKTYTLAELKNIAKDRGLTGYSRLNKAELLSLLNL